MAITIKEVTGRQDLRRFVRFPNELYAGNEYYVPQIEWILCVRKYVMSKTEMVLLVLTSVLLGLKCKQQLTHHELHLL